jgi:predicted DNA-binding antitoxin AbrB/MazE fold protein
MSPAIRPHDNLDKMSTSQEIQAVYEDGVLKPLEPLHLAEHQHVRVSVSSDAGSNLPTSDAGESFYDAASRLGFIGCVKGAPSDLSTNKKYLEGFGSNGG